MSPLQFRHQPIQIADDQYLQQHLHHVQLIARYEPASFALRQHLVPRCCAMCEARHALLLQRSMLRCSAPCGKDLVRCAHAQTFLLLLAMNRFPAWRWQDCVQLQLAPRAFEPHRPQVLQQHHLR